MKTDRPKTWPIATIESGRFAFIGLPQRLGSGELPTHETYDQFLPLEAVAGDNWLAQILGVLLPHTATWAWWTPSRTKGLMQLAPRAMTAVVSLKSLDHVMGRSWFWRGMTLAIVPPTRKDAQNLVLDWAGIDTEQIPEFILAAAPSLENWDSRVISSWCLDRSAWRYPDSVAALQAERVIVLFDGDVYCALPSDHATTMLRAVNDLAARWGLKVIPGPKDLAWPTPANP